VQFGHGEFLFIGAMEHLVSTNPGVIPAKAGIHFPAGVDGELVPAFARDDIE
jgi:hypothetical protein